MPKHRKILVTAHHLHKVIEYLADECKHYEECRFNGENTRSHIYHSVVALERDYNANLKR